MFVPNTTSRPPLNLAIPKDGQILATTLVEIPFLFLLYKAFQALQKGDSTAILFTIGGIIASALEPVVDVLGFCFFPREGSWVAFEWMGRPIPWFVPPCYAWFVGGQGYWFLTMMRNKKTTRSDIWKLWLKSFAANLCLEYPAMAFGMYVYYGYQPLAVAGFPLWFPACHATSPMMAAVLIYLMEPHLKGFKKLAIPGIVSSSYSMVNAGCGWPVWCALSVDLGYHVTYPAAFVTVGLIVTTIWAMTLPFPEDNKKLN